MRKMIILSLLALSMFTVTGCAEANSVHLKFLQMPFKNHATNEEGDGIGYYFENRIITETLITYNRGHYLTKQEIDMIRQNTLNYIVPPLNGDGYWSYTFFTTEFNEQTGLSTNYLSPQYLNNDISVYFGIYG